MPIRDVPQSVLKREIVDHIERAVKQGFVEFTHEVEIDRLSPLEIKIRVLSATRPSRVFLIRVSEKL